MIQKVKKHKKLDIRRVIRDEFFAKWNTVTVHGVQEENDKRNGFPTAPFSTDHFTFIPFVGFVPLFTSVALPFFTIFTSVLSLLLFLSIFRPFCAFFSAWVINSWPTSTHTSVFITFGCSFRHSIVNWVNYFKLHKERVWDFNAFHHLFVSCCRSHSHQLLSFKVNWKFCNFLVTYLSSTAPALGRIILATLLAIHLISH